MRITVLFFVFIISSCAIGPKFTPAPPPPDGKGLLYLMRGDVYHGGGFPTKFIINDRIVAKLYDQGYTWIHLPPGTYKVRAGGIEKKIKITISGGETHYFRYHQVSKSTYSYFNIFEKTNYNDIKSDLTSARYKKSNDYESAEYTILREFENNQTENSAELSINLSENFNGGRADLDVYYMDDPEYCYYQRQKITHEDFKGEVINLPTKATVTLLLTAMPKSYLPFETYTKSYYCSTFITFNPEENQSIEMDFSIQKVADKNWVCNISMKDKLNGSSYDFLPRSMPEKFSRASPRCTPEDFKAPEYISNYEFRFNANPPI
ncbi:hypothetical protein ACG1BZ_05185 [Microbulbifer sp. CNSA002]|uniref:hypothetical protein n=1 Tax=Microbulbifer sp. CNSA002 TaxID=3373604 RepID=UPI0039B55055